VHLGEPIVGRDFMHDEHITDAELS